MSDNRDFGKVVGIEDKAKIELDDNGNLRDKLPSELEAKTKEIETGAAEVQQRLNDLGKLLVKQALANFIDSVGLDKNADIKTLITEANNRKMLFQNSGTINMIGLQLMAALIDKMPLIDTNKYNPTIQCVCGEQHRLIKKLSGHRKAVCKKLEISEKAVTWPRLTVQFYGACLRYVLKTYNIEPHESLT